MINDNEAIDLNKLSQRELIILLHSDVKELKVEMKESNKKQSDTELKVNTLETKFETKSRVWGGLTGFITAVVTIVIERFMK